MAELATIARPYAEALFQSSKNDLNGTTQWLDALAAVAGNPQLLQYAGNPKVGKRQVFDLVSEVARVQLPPAGQNFLRTVIDNGRLVALPEVAQQFREMKNAWAALPTPWSTAPSPSPPTSSAVWRRHSRSGLVVSSISPCRKTRPSSAAFAWWWATRCWTPR
jgi:F-type H+-transporting ATPase subunit delta